MNYSIKKTYLDSPREDCNGYYYDVYEFKTLKQAISYYYSCYDNYDSLDCYSLECLNFSIPLEIRIKHNDYTFIVRNLKGQFKKEFYSFDDAKKYRDTENKFIMNMKKAGLTDKNLFDDYFVKIYIA